MSEGYSGIKVPWIDAAMKTIADTDIFETDRASPIYQKFIASNEKVKAIIKKRLSEGK